MTPGSALLLRLRFQLWARLRAGRYPSYHLSHSQFGEDMVLRGIVPGRGYFVDVGAHHPVGYSNTYALYRRGWRGLNIDAAPGSMAAFRVLRRGDRNVECCVSAQGGTVTLHTFRQGALNTTDPQAAEAARVRGADYLGAVDMPALTLDQVLERYGPPKGTAIDLLCMDLEGVDAAVLATLDWDRWTPSVVVFEQHEPDLLRLESDSTVRFLGRHGYVAYAVCGRSVVLRRAPSAESSA